jgi:predicted nucleic-acid-binding protein
MADLIDSGIFIRHLTGDHPVQSVWATRVLDDIAKGRRDGYTTAAAVAEVIYVLGSPRLSYGWSRLDIRANLLPLIKLEHLQIDHKHLFDEIFDLYVSTSADFVDCYHAVLARELGLHKVITFDSHYRNFPFIPWGCP